MTFAFAGLLLLLLGFVLLARGLRGDAIDDHRLCPECGADLTGKPESSTRCPECGADLTNPKSIRVGHRKRRGKTLALGVFIALIAACGFAVSIALTHSTVNWRAYAPVWWLAREATSSDAVVSDAALQELLSRLGNKNLTVVQIDRLLEQALAFQKDVSKPWNPLWGSFIENARVARQVSDARWNCYCQQAVQITLKARPAIGATDLLPVAIEYHPLRIAASSPVVAVVYQLGTDNKPPDSFLRDSRAHVLTPGSGASDNSLFDPQKAASLTSGPQPIQVAFGAIMHFPGRSSDMHLDPIKLSVPVMILPPGQSSAVFTSDPSLRKKVEQSISLPFGVDLERSTIDLMVNQAPTGMAFDAFIRINHREMLLGSIAAPAGKTVRTTLRNPTFMQSPEQRAEIILRPSLDAAIKTLDVFQVYNAEFTLQSPTPRPTAQKKSK